MFSKSAFSTGQIFSRFFVPRSQLTNLKPVQLTELEAEFSKVEGEKPVPQRYIKSEQQKQFEVVETEEVDGGGPEDGTQDEDEQLEMDPYDLADPVDILSQLPKDFYDKIEAKKWQERKETLENLEKLVKTPKLANGDYSDLIRALKKMIEKDSNVVVVALAGRCLGAVASGLKKKFQPYAGACVPSLLEKFKEKKQNVVTAVKEAIDIIYLSTTLDAILEDVIEALGNKNPSVKAETSYFLARALTKTQPSVISKKTLKALCAPLLKNINESDPTVRDSAAEALGTLMKLVGEKTVSPFLVELEKDAIKMGKVKECCEKAVITVKIAAPKKERPTTAPAKAVAPSRSKTTTQAAPKSAPTAAPSKAGSKKKVAAINSATVVRPKAKAGAAAKKPPTEKELSDDEAEEILSEFLGPNVLTEMVDVNYKTRLAAVDQYFQCIKSMSPNDIPTQAFVKCLSRKPGLKDTNFQVLQIKLEIIKYLAANSNFSSTAANICINDIMEKFGDAKNGNLVHDTMTAMSEATSLGFISSTAVDFALNQKSPKVIIETLNWLSNAIKDFGFNDLNTKLFIDSAKKSLASSNPGVRQAAISFLGVLYMYIQNPLYTYFETEKAILRDQINAEFQKYQGVKPPIPTKGISKCASTNSLDNLDDEEGGGDALNNKNSQDLLPRVDISGQLTETLLSELEDKNWKTRTETLTRINQIIQEAKFIKPNLGDLPQALNKRLSDSNKQVAQTSLNVCENIAKSMGGPCKQYIKVFFPMFLRNWGDNKPQLRSAAKEAIEAYVEHGGGYKEFFENEMIVDALKTGTPQLKIELWDWLADILPKIPVKSVSKDELAVCVPILYNHLEDRMFEIRANSQKAILGIMMHVGYELMVKQMEKLKTASQSEIRKKLDAERGNLPIQTVSKPVEKEEKVVRGTKPVANSKNAVKLKAPVKTASTTSKKKEEEIDTSPLLVVNNMKHQRTIDESKLKVLKWNFTTPREEFVDLLRDQMAAANVNKNLISSMFHSDFGYHIKALESLMEDLHENSHALIANLDLILKWLTLRFFDTNPSVVFKGLEYLQSVFNMLSDSNYKMLESEAASFLPYLVVKIGDAKFCSTVRSLFKQICYVYPVSRVFTYMMEGVKSKNARQRAECLEVMGSIIRDYGISVCGSSPAAVLKEVAKQVSDKDKTVRNAALNCLVEAYNIVGDKLYKMIGNILGKDQSLLEGRIKHSKRTTLIKPIDVASIIPKEQEVNVETVPAEMEAEKNDEEDEDDELPPVIMPQKSVPEVNEAEGPYALDPELLARLDNMSSPCVLRKVREFDLDFLKEDVYIPKLSPADLRAKILPLSPPKPLDPNASISRLHGGRKESPKKQDPVLTSYIQQIASPDQTTSLQGLQEMIQFLTNVKNNAMINHENEFIRAIITQLKHLRNQDPVQDPEVCRMYRSVLAVMDAFFKNGSFGQQISVDNLKDIIDQFIYILVESKLKNCPNGDAFVRVVNTQCVKIIEKSDHTRIICSQVKLIHESVRIDNAPRHTELVMKCLWRIIKLMPNWGEEIDYDSVLLEIHNFLKEFPSMWWKNKPVDTPLRTIKTILHSCIKIKGGTIMQHFGKISNPHESEIESYVLKVLKSMNLEAAPSVQPQRQNLSRATHNMLTEIFQKIGNKEETKDGLNLLYDFLQQHPETDIDPFLKKSSKFFQDYIQNGLREIADSRSCTKENFEKTEDNVEAVVDVNKGPEYWEARLQMWQKVINGEEVAEN